MSKLYERTLYLNKDIEFLTNVEIIEYDISSAGFNLCKYFHLLDEKKLKRLEKLGKKDRQIQLGLYQRQDKTLSKKLNDSFKEARKMFFEANRLEDNEILSIKKDAIFVLRRCNSTEFGNLTFVEKNIYSSYYFMNNKEFYYNKERLDVKGIDDRMLVKHRNHMLAFLSNVFNLLETSDISYIRKTLASFSDYYKNRLLDIGYYRELNEYSLFRLKKYKLFDGSIGIDNCEDVDEITIDYNFINYIIPLITIVV